MPPTPTDPPGPLPPALWRPELRMAGVVVCITVGVLVAALVLGLPAFELTVVVATFGAIWITRRRTVRIQRAVRACSGRACVRCVYDLRGLGDRGACPECGRQFDITVDQRSWKRAGLL